MRNNGSIKARNQGFTLVELVVVIVILGILAATALPRFINVSTQARTAAVQGVAGGLRSAVALAQASYIAVGNNLAVTSNMNGTAVAVAVGTGIPTTVLAGIGLAMSCTATTGDCNGIITDLTVAPATFRPANGGAATCGATYAATGVVTIDVSTC